MVNDYPAASGQESSFGPAGGHGASRGVQGGSESTVPWNVAPPNISHSLMPGREAAAQG